MTLRKHLALLAIGMLLPILALSAVAMMILMKEERAAAERGVQETARTIALAIDREIAAAEAALRVLADSPSLARGNIKDFYQQAKHARTSENAWILLADRDGQQIINTLAPLGTPLPPRADFERVKTVMSTRKGQVSDLFTGALTRRLVLSIDVPVPLAEGQRYVLTQSFFPEHFDTVLRERPLPEGWVAAINDRQGRTITRSQRSVEFIGKPISPALYQAAAANTEGSLTHLGREGSMLYDYYTRSAESGWLVVVGVPVAMLNAPARRAGLIAVLGLAGTLSVLTGVAFFFARRLSRSIGAAAHAAAMIGHAQSPADPPSSSIDELRALHAALGTAARDLEAQRAARTLAERERERLFEAEQKARKEAEAQSRAKDQFLAMLGHELRNPLAAVSNAIQLIERGAPDTKTTTFAHEVIARQTRQLSHLLDDLLDVSRVLIGKIELKREPVDLATAVEAGVHTVRAAGHVKSSVLKTDFEKVYVSADRARLEQIVVNLVGNALRYSPEGATVSVRVRREGDAAVLSVSDTGIGLAPEELERIFDLFFQAKNELYRQGGLGVGLTLVRRIVELHGGTVRAESGGAGHGATFTVTLPAIEEPAVNRMVAPRSDIPAPSMSVLIVEDNEDARAGLAMLLEVEGYSVHEAETGPDGVAAAQKLDPDIALVDIGLPGLDGYAVARAIRASGNRHTLLIALTGYGQPSDARAAIEAGFDRHLVKPVDFEALGKVMETARTVRS